MKNKVKEIFFADLRSLAALRVGVAVILIASLVFRSISIPEYYTDEGVIPSKLISFSTHPFAWSFHALNGSIEFQIVLFIIAIIFSFLLLVGYKTKLSTIVSFVLLLSLENRNIMVTDGSDALLRILLLWGIFLPWGGRYSVDYIKNAALRKLPDRVFSIGTLGYFLQIVMIYLTTSLFKIGPEWTKDYTAVYYSYHYDIFASPLAKFLLNFPTLLEILTFFVKWVEMFGALLFFFPFYTAIVRTVTVAVFIMIHLGIGSTLLIGFFPFISIVSFLGILPSEFWNQFFIVLGKIKRFDLKIYFDSDCGFCREVVYWVKTFFVLPSVKIIPAQNNPKILSLMQKENSFIVELPNGRRFFRSGAVFYIFRASPILFPISWILIFPGVSKIIDTFYNFIAKRRHATCPVVSKNQERGRILDFSFPLNFLAFLSLIYIILWNVQNFYPLNVPTSYGYAFGMYQKWAMFSPSPPKKNAWFVITGKLENGVSINLLNPEKPISWEEPSNLSLAYDYKLKNILTKLDLSGDSQIFRVLYASYLCRSWNTKHKKDKRMFEVQIDAMIKWTPPPGYILKPTEKETIINYSCLDDKYSAN